jgi:antitoxin component HigA of HigAB toxin-antitoxin module
MSRKILFQSGSPVQQLNRIVDLLGTPSLQDLTDAKASKGAITYILSKQQKLVSE